MNKILKKQVQIIQVTSGGEDDETIRMDLFFSLISNHTTKAFIINNWSNVLLHNVLGDR